MAKSDRIVRSLIRDRFVFTLLDDVTFEGVLLDSDERTFVLVDAAQIAADGSRKTVDGQLILDRTNVDYVQKPKA